MDESCCAVLFFIGVIIFFYFLANDSTPTRTQVISPPPASPSPPPPVESSSSANIPYAASNFFQEIETEPSPSTVPVASTYTPTTPAKPQSKPAKPSTPRNSIALLGSSGSGKTVFFAMLSLVLNRPEYTSLKMEYQEGIGYIRDVREPLERGEWPAQTLRHRIEKFSAIIYDMDSRGMTVHHLFMNDISGEDFTRYIGPDSVGELPEHMEHVSESSSFILIVSPETLNQDMWTFLSLMKYLVKAKKLPYGMQFREKFAIVLSKHDRHKEIYDARDYIMKHAPDFYTNLEIRVPPQNIEFFLCSAVGDLTADQKPRLPLSPIGVTEVIEWVLGKRKPAGQNYPCPRCGTLLMWSQSSQEWLCPRCGMRL